VLDWGDGLNGWALALDSLSMIRVELELRDGRTGRLLFWDRGELLQPNGGAPRGATKMFDRLVARSRALN
jgi:hypothetical protein